MNTFQVVLIISIEADSYDDALAEAKDVADGISQIHGTNVSAVYRDTRATRQGEYKPA